MPYLIGMGRITKYKKEYCDQIIKHMEEGLSLESFAGVVGICRATLYEWFKVHEEFSEAKEIGLMKSLLWWDKHGPNGLYSKSFRDSEGNSESISINSTMWTFNMKNRFGWRDKQVDEHDTVINNYQSLSEEEIDAKIAELMKSNK